MSHIMTSNQKRKLIQANNIRAEVVTNWKSKRTKFTPNALVNVIAGPKRKFQGNQYYFRNQTGTVIAASANSRVFDPFARRSSSKYYVQFEDSVIGFDGYLLRHVV